MIADGKFRKHEHILKSKDYRAVYRKGLSVKQGPLVLSYLPNGLANSRIGFSISARSVKLASRRNRTRRLFREAYRKNKGSIKTGFDIVFIAKRSFPENMVYSDAEETLLKIIKGARLSA
jgi:ribonuclease P protein component